MMASLSYATPPPDNDMNGEDTSVLSDTSNSSQTNSSITSQSKAPKRSILASSPPAMSSASSYALLGALFDQSHDLSKKRRKQTTPIRISATAAAAAATAAFNASQKQLAEAIERNGGLLASSSDITEIQDDDDDEELSTTAAVSASASQDNESRSSSAAPTTTAETEGLQKIFLKNLSQLQAAQKHSSESQPTVISSSNESSSQKQRSYSPMSPLELNNHQHHEDKIRDFENDIEVEFHNKFIRSSSHAGSDKSDEPGKKSSSSDDKKSSSMGMIDESWLSLTSLPFPFPPEAAAAALSASGYLPNLPLLASGGLQFGSHDGMLSRGSAPLRIFNPEAYCDLCNKEFCNKYFLKTHKANKHGIYEPMGSMSSSDMPTSLSQLTQMQQMQHVLQMQQQFNHQQNIERANAAQQAQAPPKMPSLSPAINSQETNGSANANPAPFCDICFKKFSSTAALKKHRVKIHDIGGKSTSSHSSDSSSHNNNNNNVKQHQQQQEDRPHLDERETCGNNDQMLFNLPEGFREDYQIEQEDANFTPEPRKLSPTSMQQAKDANFSYDKLKRLGVINPEAFCELCCKEYCNKYFLRTHKLKRHGIFLPSDDKDDARALWPYMQTSPLNLIMGGDLKALQLYARKKEELEKLSALSERGGGDYDESKDDEKMLMDNNDDDDEQQQQHQHDKEKKMSPPSPSALSQQESDAISVDLQKLQSMILQLNELNQKRCVNCAICGKEMENQYMLHAHMLAEHSGFTNNNSIKLSPTRPSSAPSPGEFEMCKQCDKEFPNIFLLKQHLIEQHGNGVSVSAAISSSLSPQLPREGFVTPDRKPQIAPSQPSTPTQNDRKQIFQMTPTSSYCEICNKELCNKYFMKTHMQRMHGIEIENGAQIGGVVCNICNKELCSKYFLRVHKHNTHGIVEDGSPQQQRPSSESVDSDQGFQLDLKPGEVSDQSNRYFSHFTEVCPLCSRRFRSAKWLKAHLMSDHGKAGVDKLQEIENKLGPIKAPSPGLKIPNGGYNLSSPDLMIKTSLGGLFPNENPMATSPGAQNSLKGYQCSFCSFSTPILAILFIHERSHQGGNAAAAAAMNLMQNPTKSENAVSLAKDLSRDNQQLTATSVSSPSSTPASTPVPSHQPEMNNGKADMKHIIESMPQFSQRPSVGLPQHEAGQLVMQSFLLEESPMFASKSMVNGKTGTNDNYKFIPSMVILPVRERVSSPITVSFTLTPA